MCPHDRNKVGVFDKMPNRINAVQECDARDDDSSTAAWFILVVSMQLGINNSFTFHGALFA